MRHAGSSRMLTASLLASSVLACSPEADPPENPTVSVFDPFMPTCEWSGCWELNGELGGATLNGGLSIENGWDEDGNEKTYRDLRLMSQAFCGGGFTHEGSIPYRCDAWLTDREIKIDFQADLSDVGPLTELETKMQVPFAFFECLNIHADGEWGDVIRTEGTATLYLRPLDPPLLQAAVIGESDDGVHSFWMTGDVLLCDSVGETGVPHPEGDR